MQTTLTAILSSGLTGIRTVISRVIPGSTRDNDNQQLEANADYVNNHPPPYRLLALPAAVYSPLSYAWTPVPFYGNGGAMPAPPYSDSQETLPAYAARAPSIHVPPAPSLRLITLVGIRDHLRTRLWGYITIGNPHGATARSGLGVEGIPVQYAQRQHRYDLISNVARSKWIRLPLAILGMIAAILLACKIKYPATNNG